ncbi:hypothetical protein [Solimonas terrae]|uniref:Uncharacterized protein n=1 Tax=Solimonas terrae TaxID=1396819 RepID=A0A6M2BM72_9GAMM|nr:hypothetical protein [Solimonas terrae]NGY03494.1 hypothetical protein [Solimonas terrae]
MKFQKCLLLCWCAALSCMVAACSGVGHGSKPDHLVIAQTNGLLGLNSGKSFLCFPEALTLSIVFDNGHYDSGFATRAHWASSNPDVAAVSNGDILYPGSTTLAYGAGVVIPNQPGTTTITASFSSLNVSYDLTVETPTSFSVDQSSVSMVKHTSTPINAKTVVDGYTRTVTGFGTWSFTDQPADEVTGSTTSTDSSDNPLDSVVQLASSSSGVTLVAGDTLGTRTAQMALNCPDGSDVAAMAQAALQIPVNVRELKTLSLTPEFPASQAINVMTYTADTKTQTVNTTETMKTIAGFGDGVSDTQDLSGQVTLQSSDSTVIAPVIGYVSVLKAGTANITASFPVIDADGNPVYDDVDPVTSAPVTVTGGERTFKSLAISPADEQTLTALDDLQYSGIATFTDNTTQDITRHVIWSVSDASVATIGNNLSIKSGDLFSLTIPTDGPVSVDVTAALGSASDAPTVTVPLKIQALD